uniref:Ig-like domain-containing protein n=1 Tax=Calidris pygmaea TaxID=425635 RepID=A0A8C3JFY2_9CHAR
TDPSAALALIQTVDISCYQNYTRLAYMYWYQQPPRHGLKLVASIVTWMKNSYEEGYSELTIQHFVTVTTNNLIFGDGTKLTVIGTDDKIIPPSVAIFSPSKQEIQQKNKATLVCLASGFYPDHLNLFWKVNGAKRTEGVGTDEFSTQNGNEKTFSLTSRLRISAQEWFNPFNRFECVAKFFKNGTLDSTHKLIYGDAESHAFGSSSSVSLS